MEVFLKNVKDAILDCIEVVLIVEATIAGEVEEVFYLLF